MSGEESHDSYRKISNHELDQSDEETACYKNFNLYIKQRFQRAPLSPARAHRGLRARDWWQPPSPIQDFASPDESRRHDKRIIFEPVVDEASARSIEHEASLIYEVKDICDELHLITRVLENQSSIIHKFSHLFWPGHTGANEKMREDFIRDCGTGALIERAKRLQENAQRILDAVSGRETEI